MIRTCEKCMTDRFHTDFDFCNICGQEQCGVCMDRGCCNYAPALSRIMLDPPITKEAGEEFNLSYTLESDEEEGEEYGWDQFRQLPPF